MQLTLPLLAVKSVEVSKQFYAELFDQTVTLDLGKNVTLSGGFALQEDFAQLIGLDPASVAPQPHNMELYFEVDDFDESIKRLEAHGGVRYVHPPKKHDWQQRVVRIYDPDGHIIEVGESMAVIARRYLRKGYSIDETAQIIQHPREFVKACASAERKQAAEPGRQDDPEAAGGWQDVKALSSLLFDAEQKGEESLLRQAGKLQITYGISLVPMLLLAPLALIFNVNPLIALIGMAVSMAALFAGMILAMLSQWRYKTQLPDIGGLVDLAGKSADSAQSAKSRARQWAALLGDAQEEL